jgi:hypothetical protein
MFDEAAYKLSCYFERKSLNKLFYVNEVRDQSRDQMGSRQYAGRWKCIVLTKQITSYVFF